MADIIDGKAFAESLRKRIASETARIKSEANVTPGLAVVLVGEDPASKVYVKNKGKQTVEAGMNSKEFQALRRRRNYAVFGGIMLLCVIFYLITIVRVGGF